MIEYASYFSLGDCMEGLNLIFNNLYDINLILKDVDPGEGWAEQIHKLAGNNLDLLIFFLFCKYIVLFSYPHD